MIDIKKVCFSAFVFGDYYNFIPFFIYSAKKKYFGVTIKLFFYDESANIYNSKLRDLNEEGVEIIYLNKIPVEFKANDDDTAISKAQMLKSQRWLMKSDYFKGYEYVYVSDVDILFSGNKNLLKSFEENFQTYAYPFSNKVRFKGDKNQYRLTGLQFMKLKEYYLVIDKCIERFKEDTVYRKKLLRGVTGNEHLLYNLVFDAFDFDPEKLKNAQRWHGGINMGGNLKYKKQKFVNLILLENGCTKVELANDLIAYSRDQVFLDYINNYFSLSTYQIFKWFGINLFPKLSPKNKLKVIYHYNIVNSLMATARYCIGK